VRPVVFRMWIWGLPAVTTLATVGLFLAVSLRWTAVMRPIGSDGPPVAAGLAIAIIALALVAVCSYAVMAGKSKPEPCGTADGR
jgi:hypothetical protein